jgi:hypothetical protein
MIIKAIKVLIFCILQTAFRLRPVHTMEQVLNSSFFYEDSYVLYSRA